jgi:hypothetical protein
MAQYFLGVQKMAHLAISHPIKQLESGLKRHSSAGVCNFPVAVRACIHRSDATIERRCVDAAMLSICKSLFYSELLSIPVFCSGHARTPIPTPVGASGCAASVCAQAVSLRAVPCPSACASTLVSQAAKRGQRCSAGRTRLMSCSSMSCSQRASWGGGWRACGCLLAAGSSRGRKASIACLGWWCSVILPASSAAGRMTW